jgi:hypothetical protein
LQYVFLARNVTLLLGRITDLDASRRMELADAPLSENMLDGLGEDLHEAREHPWASTCSAA